MERQKSNNNYAEPTRYGAYLLLILFGVFILTIGVLVFRSVLLNKAYPMMTTATHLNDTITHIIRDGRKGVHVVFGNGVKYTLPWARNFNYVNSRDLSELIGEGDVIRKNANSDTIRVIHNGTVFVYVSENSIPVE